MEKRIRIVVLDSGLDPSSKLAKKMDFSGGIGFYENDEGEIELKFEETDEVGHGTAVASCIDKLVDSIEIIPIKIMYNEFMATTETLIASLQYIYENIPCDIINISAGIVACEDIEGLRVCCEQLRQRNTIIVSAYDNMDSISYPAALDCVIGVSGIRQMKSNQILSVENNYTDFIGSIKEKRLPWLHGKIETVSGNSFVAPEFTALIAKWLKKRELRFDDICNSLDDLAIKKLSTYDMPIQSIGFDINKAIVFPFNKEMHSLARYQELLFFEVVGYYDVKYSGNINKTVSDLQNINNNAMTVKDIESLDWEGDFDTVILGHNSILSKAIGKDLETYITQKCIQFNKNIYSCKDIRNRDDLVQSTIKFNCPYIENFTKPDIQKMHVMGCPTVGVVGTGSNQGKYTIQLGLRKELLKLGYNVGQLGTEPTALLYGMDAVYPMGHESSVYVKGFDAVYILNQLMGNIEKKNPEIIIFGSQSNTVPYHVGGPQDYPVVQHELLLGCQADAYILCVSDDAPIDYIRRTISYLEGVFESQVIAIVVSPLASCARWSNINSNCRHIETDEMQGIINQLNENFSIPVLAMNEMDFYTQLTNVVLDSF